MTSDWLSDAEIEALEAQLSALYAMSPETAVETTARLRCALAELSTWRHIFGSAPWVDGTVQRKMTDAAKNAPGTPCACPGGAE